MFAHDPCGFHHASPGPTCFRSSLFDFRSSLFKALSAWWGCVARLRALQVSMKDRFLLHHTVSRAQGIVGAWQGRVAQRSHLQLRLKSPMTFSDIGTPHGSHIIHNCGPTARTISTYIHNVSIQNVVDPQIMPFEKLNNIEESVVSSCKLGLLENTGGRVYRVQRKEILK